jgi:hypothetical protein
VIAPEFEEPRAKAFECSTDYRGYRWFDRYKPQQLEALGLVPAWFAETFIIDHANAASWLTQKDRLLAVDSLRLVVASLQDSVMRLEAANAAAYATGYDVAHASYQDLTRRYIAELNKRRIKLPSLVGFVGAVGVGFVVGG